MSSNIEDIFKQKFEKFEEQPSADLFNRIKAKQRKNKIVIWWTAAVVGLLVVAGSLFLIPQKNTIESPITQTETIDKTIAPATETVSPSEENAISIEEINTAEKRVASPSVERQKQQLKEVPNYTSKTVSQNKTEKPPLNTKIVDPNLANKFNEILAQKGTKNPDKATIYIKDKMYDVGQRPKITPKNIDSKEGEESLPEGEPKININTPNINSTGGDFAEGANDPDDEDLPGNAHKANKWSIQIAGSPGYATRFLTGDNQIIDKRNATENNKLSYYAEALATYSISEKWNAGLGISYQNRNEGFAMQTQTVHKETIISFDTFIVYQEPLPPRQVIVPDTNYQISTTVEDFEHQNHYKIVNIPLFAERVFYLDNNKWTIFTQAGITTTIWQKSEGQIIEGDNPKLLELSSLNKNKIGINSITLGFGVGYKVSDKVNVVFYPKANYLLNSLYDDNYALKQQEFGLFSSFGIRYKF